LLASETGLVPVALAAVGDMLKKDAGARGEFAALDGYAAVLALTKSNDTGTCVVTFVSIFQLHADMMKHGQRLLVTRKS
jgi:hypothetical protein